MTQEQREKYQETDELREVFRQLAGRKFKLDCGHHVTFGNNFLGNDITVYQTGKDGPEIICSQCGY